MSMVDLAHEAEAAANLNNSREEGGFGGDDEISDEGDEGEDEIEEGEDEDEDGGGSDEESGSDDESHDNESGDEEDEEEDDGDVPDLPVDIDDLQDVQRGSNAFDNQQADAVSSSLDASTSQRSGLNAARHPHGAEHDYLLSDMSAVERFVALQTQPARQALHESCTWQNEKVPEAPVGVDVTDVARTEEAWKVQLAKNAVAASQVSLSLSVSLSVTLSLSLPLHLSRSRSVGLSLSLPLSLSLSPSLSLWPSVSVFSLSRARALSRAPTPLALSLSRARALSLLLSLSHTLLSFSL